MFTWARPSPAPTSRDWYRAASEEERREYDAFGPWVYEVTSEAEMPRAFRAAWPRHRDATPILKVPIDADRLQCRPGMDLYSTVLAIHPDRLAVLRLVDGAVEARDIAWSEIVAIESYANLLIGRWILHLADGSELRIDHGAVGARRMERVTGLVRAKLARPEGRLTPDPSTAVTIDDLFYRNMLVDAGRDAARPVVAIHWEPQNRRCRDAADRRRLTTGILFVDTPDELVIVDRDSPTRRRLHPVWASRLVRVPWGAIEGWALDDEPKVPGGFRELVLGLREGTLRRWCLTTPTTVTVRLAAHGVPRVG